MTDAEFMGLAIRKAEEGIAAGQSPFGAVIVRGDRLVVAAHNTVWRDGDPTAHAEVNAIRQAARSLGTIDLSGGTIYSTCEPCPMCLGAIHWAKLKRLVYGATIEDAATAGFSELRIRAQRLAEMGGSSLHIVSGCLPAQCRSLFVLWKQSALARPY
jgi:guanine deaminase